MTDPIGPSLPFWQRDAPPAERTTEQSVTPPFGLEHIQAPPSLAPGYGLEHAGEASEPVYGFGAQPHFFEEPPAFQAPPVSTSPPNGPVAAYTSYLPSSYSGPPTQRGPNLRWMAGVLALLLVAGGGWFLTHRSSNHQASRAAVAVVPSVSVPSAALSSIQPATANTTAGQLEAKLIANLPTGYVQQPDAVGDTGPSDLAKAIRDDGEPGAGSALRAANFVAGYQRLWLDADQGEIIDYVYQFQTPLGAKAYYDREKALLPVGAPSKPKPFTVAGLPGTESMGATFHQGAAGYDTALAMTLVGKYLVQVACNGTGGEASPQLATSLIIQQAHLF